MAKTNIIICQGSSCFSRGNKENLQAIQSFIDKNNLNAGIDFKGQLCTEYCLEGPIIIIDEKVYKEVSPEKVENIMNDHFKL